MENKALLCYVLAHKLIQRALVGLVADRKRNLTRFWRTFLCRQAKSCLSKDSLIECHEVIHLTQAATQELKWQNEAKQKNKITWDEGRDIET